MKDVKCGGPSSGKEKCSMCGKMHMVHRLGSWDWEPKKCDKCVKKQLEMHENIDNWFKKQKPR